MASIGQLVRIVAEMSGLDESSVKLIARYVREAGLIGQQSTGAGAAKMTARDAASLLIAVNSTTVAKDAARATREFYNLPFNSNSLGQSHPEVDYMVGELSEAECFGASLARLIELYMPTVEGLTVLQYPIEDAPVRVIITFEQPNNEASLSVWEHAGKKYGLDFAGSFRTVNFSGNDKDAADIDRTVSVKITGKTIRSISELLAN